MTGRVPLYLVDGGGLDIRYEAPALRVRSPNNASVLFPLPRVSRIVSRGAVSWSASALTGCLEHAVPVLFVDREGRVLGVLAPAGRAETSIGDHLSTVALANEWVDRYQNWRCSQERRVITAMVRVLGWNLDDMRASKVNARLDAALERRWGVSPRKLLRGYFVCLQATVDERLAAFGIAPELAYGISGETHLARDLASLVSWPLRGRILAATERPPAEVTEAIHYYEVHLANPLGHTLDRLVRRLWSISP